MMGEKIIRFAKKNVVTLLFVALCIFTTAYSGQSASFILQELISRICRNAVLILSLLMPVLCGMGLNFSIVLGAAAGQIALILITHWNIGGLPGMALCLLIATAISILFGMFAGFIFNRTVGQEMITGMIVGYFAKGVFDLIFLILVGTWLIPIHNPKLILAGGVGLKNTIDLNPDVKYVFDKVLQVSFLDCLLYGLLIMLLVTAALLLIRILRQKKTLREAVRVCLPAIITTGVFAVALAVFRLVPSLYQAASFSEVPVFTVLLIAGVCLLNAFLCRTKLGQDIRTCGQNMQVAAASGIRVGRTRIAATVISTVIAAWGQIIFLQNMGLINTYTSHEQVGTYAVAALLVGGASIRKATIPQVFIGALLFHLLFFTMPLAGNQLFNDSQIGEYFRVFISYGVIAVALALHAWNRLGGKKKKS